MNSAKAVPLAAVVERDDFLCRRVPDVGPAQLLLIVLEATLKRFSRALLSILIARLIDVQKSRVHQERNLLDHGQRISDSALPEFRP
jgi:hypothetical protein